MRSVPICALSSSGVPCATVRPWSRTTMSSDSRSASSRYCVVRMTVVPSRTRSRSWSQRPLRLFGSRPVVGSSRKSTLGRPTRLAARSRRRRMPPEKVFTSVSAASTRSSCSRSSPARWRASPLGRPYSRPTISRLNRPVRRPSTVASWAATPMRRRTWSASSTTSKPATDPEPSVGTARVVRMRIAVVLPAPLWPRRPSTVPGATLRSRSRRAQRSP